MLRNWNLTLMYLLILYSHLQNTQKSETTYIIFHLHFIFFIYIYLYIFFLSMVSTNSVYTYKQSTTGSTARYNDKGDKFFVTFN